MPRLLLLLADALACFHLAYVAVIVVGQLLIMIGAARGWKWVRNAAFRWTHLAMIGIVALEAMIGLTCPLTTWERQLRVAAGAPVYDGTFVSRLVNSFLVHDWPEWVFAAAHISFALLVAATIWLAPPRRRADRLCEPGGPL